MRIFTSFETQDRFFQNLYNFDPKWAENLELIRVIKKYRNEYGALITRIKTVFYVYMGASFATGTPENI